MGSTGLKISRLCLGTLAYGSKKWREWVLDEEESRPFIRRTLELGINFFDTSDMYSEGVSEEVLGRTLRDLGIARDTTVIAAKVFYPTGPGPNQRGLSRKHILHALDNSLRRLRTDYVDVYMIHRFDYETPIEETLYTLDEIVKSGKALYIGASSMYTWQFAEMIHNADRLGLSRFVVMQNHYNLVYREEEREMIPFCRQKGIGITPWSPLARGFLAGNRGRQGSGETVRAKTDAASQDYYHRDSDFILAERVGNIARRRGIPNAQVALAWVLQQPGITAPVIGATKMHHLDDAVAALDVRLDAEELEMLSEPYEPHPVLGHT
jgi:aryl-alcohol dehydrogenase (NADP+)